MSANGKSKSKAIRARLSHPVIDSDGHWREYEPLAMDYLKEVAGPKLVEKWTSRIRALGQGSFAEIDETREARPARRTATVVGISDS